MKAPGQHISTEEPRETSVPSLRIWWVETSVDIHSSAPGLVSRRCVVCPHLIFLSASMIAEAWLLFYVLQPAARIPQCCKGEILTSTHRLGQSAVLRHITVPLLLFLFWARAGCFQGHQTQNHDRQSEQKATAAAPAGVAADTQAAKEEDGGCFYFGTPARAQPVPYAPLVKQLPGLLKLVQAAHRVVGAATTIRGGEPKSLKPGYHESTVSPAFRNRVTLPPLSVSFFVATDAEFSPLPVKASPFLTTVGSACCKPTESFRRVCLQYIYL